jgi:hypothetical protein
MSEEAQGPQELWLLNQSMFQAVEAGDYEGALSWAGKVVSNAYIMKMACLQQVRKEREVGALVDYVWGTPAQRDTEAVRLIQKYPVLNEVGAAMWGMAVAEYKLGRRDEAKRWIQAIITQVPLHQIFAPNGPGYWNALVSWKDNPGGSALDADMGVLYREAVRELAVGRELSAARVR